MTDTVTAPDARPSAGAPAGGRAALPAARRRSLRAYVEALAEAGELQPIAREVDLDLEIGAICRRCYETGAPAPLFINIRGVAPGFRVLGAPAGVSARPGQYLARIALSLGLPANTHGRDIVEALVAGRGRAPVRPRRVATGPCKEHVQLGDDVDLTRLPAPVLHGGDGGRYLNTFGVIVARTPDGRWTNWSIARIMLRDKTRMTGIVAPNQHLGMIRQEWLDRGESMPFALVLGAEPFVPFVGGMPLPAGVDEADVVGAYFGEPIDVVRCETVDLDVPATAEIVIEGFLSATETDLEGPMGEYAGYITPGEGTAEAGLPRHGGHARATRSCRSLSPASRSRRTTPRGASRTPRSRVRAARPGLPGGHGVEPVRDGQPLVRDRHGARLARDARVLGGRAVPRARQRPVQHQSRHGDAEDTWCVNDDIDVTNLREVVWAFATRNYPGAAGEVVFASEATNPLVAFLRNAEKSSMHTTKVVYNCLPPDEWGDALPERSSFAGAYPPDLQRRVLDNWAAYGFA